MWRTFRGKERNQNGHSRTLAVKIWKVQRRCIIFEGRFNDTKNVRQCLAFLMYAGAIAIPVVYPDIHVQPCAISGGKYLAGLRIATYLCR